MPDIMPTATTNPETIKAITTTAAAAGAIKPGYKTTEFWLSLVSVLLGMAYASGLISDGSTIAKVAGLAASALGAFGYAVSRGQAKSGS